MMRKVVRKWLLGGVATKMDEKREKLRKNVLSLPKAAGQTRTTELVGFTSQRIRGFQSSPKIAFYSGNKML